MSAEKRETENARAEHGPWLDPLDVRGSAMLNFSPHEPHQAGVQCTVYTTIRVIYSDSTLP